MDSKPENDVGYSANGSCQPGEPRPAPERMTSEMNHIGITSLVIVQRATQSFFKLANRQFTLDFSDQCTQVIYLQGIQVNVLASLG